MEPTAVSISVQPATSPKIAIQEGWPAGAAVGRGPDHRQPGHFRVHHGCLRKPEKASQGQRERNGHRDAGKSP